jgi:hypothetical protein
MGEWSGRSGNRDDYDASDTKRERLRQLDHANRVGKNRMTKQGGWNTVNTKPSTKEW